jgi:photosystem II stability/assembly factor-like uncharacterized protein
MVLASEGSVSPVLSATLYAWRSDGLFRTDDAGKKWTELTAAGIPPSPDMRPELRGLLLVAPGDRDTVFAVSMVNTDNGTGNFEERRYLFRSTDGGRNWTQIFEYGGGLIVDAGNPSTLYAADNMGWSKSTDLGDTWTVVSGEEWVGPIVAVALDPHPPSAINVVQSTETGAYTVSRSTDGGVTWQKVRLEGVAQYLGELAFDPHWQLRMLAGLTGKRSHRTPFG